MVWSVEAAPLTPDWAGTTIMFDVEESGEGSTIRFRHQGLTPALECYDMCHEGWTHYLASLVSYVRDRRGSAEPPGLVSATSAAGGAAGAAGAGGVGTPATTMAP